MCRIALCIILLNCSIAASIPLLYVCFGFPAPHQWIEPFEFHTRDGNVYIAYYSDLLIQFLASATHPITVITALSFYLGICLYINAMVDDLKDQMEEIERMPRRRHHYYTEVSLRLMREIHFHGRIIK